MTPHLWGLVLSFALGFALGSLRVVVVRIRRDSPFSFHTRRDA
jgi:hypothetical protein